MEPDKLKELPVWFQLIAYGGLFFGTFAVAILGWVKKNVSGGLFGEKEQGSDKAVVLSAAIADSHSINQLASSIERLIEFLKIDAETDNLRLARNHDRLLDILEELRQLNSTLRQRTLI